MSTKLGKVPEGKFWPKMVKSCSNFLCTCEHDHGQLWAQLEPEPNMRASAAGTLGARYMGVLIPERKL